MLHFLMFLAFIIGIGVPIESALTLLSNGDMARERREILMAGLVGLALFASGARFLWPWRKSAEFSYEKDAGGKCAVARCGSKSWLYRALDVETNEGRFKVVYSGLGIGGEKVLVDGYEASRIKHPTYQIFPWVAPKFDFRIGSFPATIEIRIWPWIELRSVVLKVGGDEVYREWTFFG